MEAPISRDKDRLSLFIIDETASLDHDAYLLRKFFNRYVRLTAQPNIHILFIGMPLFNVANSIIDLPFCIVSVSFLYCSV